MGVTELYFRGDHTPAFVCEGGGGGGGGGGLKHIFYFGVVLILRAKGIFGIQRRSCLLS